MLVKTREPVVAPRVANITPFVVLSALVVDLVVGGPVCVAVFAEQTSRAIRDCL
jgi:hypothetical protein